MNKIIKIILFSLTLVTIGFIFYYFLNGLISVNNIRSLIHGSSGTNISNQKETSEYFQKLENLEHKFTEFPRKWSPNIRSLIHGSCGTNVNIKPIDQKTEQEINQTEPLQTEIKTLNKEIPSENLRELAELHFKGVPEKYDRYGNKIAGIEPSAQKTIEYLERLTKRSDSTDDDLIKLARIYHQGMHKFDPNIDTALQIYRYLQSNAKTPEGRQEAMESIDDIEQERVHEWLNLDYEKRKTNLNIFNNNIDDWPGVNDADDEDYDNPIIINHEDLVPGQAGLAGGRRPLADRGPGPFANGPIIRWPDADDILDQELFDLNAILLAQANENLANRPRINAIAGGAQNVHDSQVISTVKHSIEKLKETTKRTRDKNQSLREVKDYVSTTDKKDKSRDAWESIKAIEGSNDKMHGTGLTGADALDLVWNRIHDPKNEDKREVLKENLLNELAEMREHDWTVCATGRFNRIIDTLNMADDDVKIMTSGAVNQEMMNKASKIREDIMKEYSKEEQEKFDEGTHSKQDEFEDKLKETIKDTFKKDYVETKILTQDKLNKELSKWIDAI